MKKEKKIKTLKENWYCWYCGKEIGDRMMLWSLNERIDRVFIICDKESCQSFTRYGEQEMRVRFVKRYDPQQMIIALVKTLKQSANYQIFNPPNNMKKEIKIENARNNCRICGYDISEIQSDINAERDWLCFQCYVNRDAPSQEMLESRF